MRSFWEISTKEERLMLTPVIVGTLFNDCLITIGSVDNEIVVEGFTRTVSLDSKKLETNRQAIIDCLTEFPPAFLLQFGGGYSLLGANIDRHNHIWNPSGSQIIAESIFLLGMGINCVRPVLPKYLWESLPGGVPYYVINLLGFDPNIPIHQIV